MAASRVLWILLGGVAIALIGFVLASPAPWFMLGIVTETFYPTTIPWEGKTAWRRCESAIAGQTSWPAHPADACEAMHLCINEAPLSEPQMQQLSALIRATPGCQEP
jgi:hypothetical protein